jgi:uncharacterized membrane protein
MWFVGGLIGLVLGLAAGRSLWMHGLVIGTAIGAWLGWLKESGELRARLGHLEKDVAYMREEIAALRQGKASSAEPQALAKTLAMEIIPDVQAPISQAPAETIIQINEETPAQPVYSPPPEVKAPSWLARFWSGNPLVKIGVILLFFGIASGLKLAVEYGLFPISLRLFIAAAAGIGMIAFGFRKAREEKQRIFGLSLQGGGFALLYLVVYFMLDWYAMIGEGAAFTVFAVLGVACVGMAARQDGPALATLGISGAFAAPILAGGDADSPLLLFSYFTLLNVIIMAVAWFKAWRVLNIIGFVFTLVVGMAWAMDGYDDQHYLITQSFLILFLAAYSAMPTLTALFKAPGLSGWREGILLFGAPVVGSFLQSRLMEDTAYGNAWSALIAAIWYVILWAALYRQKRPENELLERSHIGLAITFFTLSIPLAFGAQVTSALWALEGAAVLWYGTQTRRIPAQTIGLLVQLAGGVALLAGWDEMRRVLPVANDVVLGGFLITVAGIVSARMLRSIAKETFISPLIPFVWAMLWWLGIGLGEIHLFAPKSLHAPFGLLYLLITVVGLEILASWRDWPQLRASSVLLLGALWLAPLFSIERGGHPLAGLMGLILPLALATHYALLRRNETHGPVYFEQQRHLGAFWLVLTMLPLELIWWAKLWAPKAFSLWSFVALALTMAGGMALPIFGIKRGWWPFTKPMAKYIPHGTMPPVLIILMLLPWAAFHLSGDGTGLPYLPVLNVFDLTQLIGMASIFALLRVQGGQFEQPLRLILLGIAFIWLSTLAGRIAHAWGGVQFDIVALTHSTLFQMLLTLFWTCASIGAMILASRRGERKIWFGGFALLGVVGGKLLLFDATGRGTLMWTGTLIGVAILVLAASYFAPLPPKAEDQPA